MSTNILVRRVAVSYEAGSLENQALGFSYDPSTMTITDAENLRPKMDYAISCLYQARARCDALLELTQRERAKAHLDNLDQA